ncbi:MAG: dephospho-CoA kinase [Alphaproteobacteria bacterium]|nr:dephospho-CoA kinase [Alphaproteobacteria bacterium]
MIVIGITGSIGCGKTYLAKIINSLGFVTYNPDFWVRDFYKKTSFLNLIKENFPQTFNDKKEFDKRKLRNIVFNDNTQLKKLENLTHPLIKKKLKYIIKKSSDKKDIIFLDAALLYEMGWDKYCDFVIVADVNDEIQKQRVMKRDNITEDDFNKIVAQQTSKEYKKIKSDYVIDTSLPYGINKVQLIKFIQEII